jgi:hypothetical protein
MSDEIKIHPYSVVNGRESESLEEIIQRISTDVLDTRSRSINFTQIRAEDIQINENHAFVDFVKMRGTHGPGRASELSAISGFNFEPGERFAEETALLYDFGLNVVFIQYNHHGVRVGSVSEYFSSYSNNPRNSITFLPKLRHDAERRLLSKNIFKSIEISAAPAMLQQSDNDLAVDSALTMMAQSSEAAKIKITLGANRRKNDSLNLQAAHNTIKWIRRMIGRGAISSAKIRARDDLDSDIELIDMIAERLYWNQQINVGPDLRWPREQRYNALQEARRNLSRFFITGG